MLAIINTWHAYDTVIVIVLLLFCALFFYIGMVVCDGIDDFFNPPNLDNLPDEITIEVVKEKPEAKPASSTASQASSCSAPSSAPAPDNSSDSFHGPMGKGGHLP